MINYPSHIFVHPATQEKRVTFGSFNQNNDVSLTTGKAGVKLLEADNLITRSYLLLRVCLGQLVKITDSNGQTLFCKEKSLKRWAWRHGQSTDDYALAINNACAGNINVNGVSLI